MSNTQGAVQETAKIYQFPVGGRAGLAARGQTQYATKAASPTVAVMGNAWYHEAAIEDAKRGYDH